jgi:hypothetical protein
MKKIFTLLLSLPLITIAQPTILQLQTAAQAFPIMPKGTANLIPFVQGQPTFSSGTPFNDLEFTCFDTDYMDGENSGADTFFPIDPSDEFPGTNKVKLVRCILNTDLDANYQSGKTDRVILGTAEHPNPFFLKGADNIDNDYCVILHFDFTNAFVQLKGTSADYSLQYFDVNTHGVKTTGWYLFYTKNGAIDLVAFIFPCDVIEPAVSGNPPQNSNPICNLNKQLNLNNVNQFKFATPLTIAPAITKGIVQYGSNGKELLGGSTKDSDGNIYLVGLTDGNLDGLTDASNEIFVTKLSPTGQVLWVYELQMKEGTFLKDAVVDETHVYVCGRTLGNLPSFVNKGKWDGIILKLDKSTGSLVTSNQWGNEGIDGYGCIAQDDNGNIFVSAQGSEAGNPNTDDKYLTAKHRKSDLANVWRRIEATTQTGFAASAEAWGGITYQKGSTPGNGKLVVAGWVISAGGANAFTSIYDNLNNVTPTRPYSNIIASTGVRAEWILDNAVDALGNYYFVGYTTGNLGGTHQGEGDAFIVKYNSTMQNPIFKQFGTVKGDLARKIEIDNDGTIYVVGYTYGDYAGNNADASLLTGDVFIQKFDANLNFLSKKQFGTPHEDRGFCHLKDDKLIITGTTEGAMAGVSKGSFDTYVAAVDKQTLEFTTIATNPTPVNPGVSWSIFPNPTNDLVTITLPSVAATQYEIFNMLGQRLETGNITSQTLKLSLGKFAKGVYLLKIGYETIRLLRN